MIEIEDHEFFDHMIQVFSKTTGSDDRYWMPEEYGDNSGRYRIYAVGEDESRKLVASSVSDKDADFITSIHGCAVDLFRRLHVALDEADRLDYEKDGLVNRVAELELEADEFASIIRDLTEAISDLESGRV